MKCPKCDTRLEEGYIHCPDCGVNVKEYKERIKLFDDIRASIFLAVVSTALILGYPTYEYLESSVNVSLKEFLSSNTREKMECSKSFDEYEKTITLNYNDNELENYEVKYNFTDTTNYNEERKNLLRFLYETGFTTTANNKDELTYSVDLRSIVNEEIYDIDNIKLNYKENIDSLVGNGYICK